MRFYYDLHIHSALSPCGDDDMTPNNIVNMALLNELDIIALSDHNTCRNLPAVAKLCERADIVFVPGVEVETAEEIHVLCLFPNVKNAVDFEKEVLVPSLADVPNDEHIFGKQTVMDENDVIIAEDKRYLINATTVDIDNIGALVCGFGGVAVPAHIDKTTKSIISMLGMVDKSMGFNTFELSKNAPVNYVETEFSLKDGNYFYIHNTDAHYLFDIAERNTSNFLELEERPSAEKIIEILRKGQL